MTHRNIGLLKVSTAFSVARIVASLPPGHIAICTHAQGTHYRTLAIEGPMMPPLDNDHAPQHVELVCHDAMTNGVRTYAMQWAHAPTQTWTVPYTDLWALPLGDTMDAEHIQRGDGDRGEGTHNNPKNASTDVEQHVDAVIGDLIGRKVPTRDRQRLGKALDTANQPERGRGAEDKAIGRITQGLR